MPFREWKLFNYTPRFNEVDRGVYWYHLVRLSVCPSVDRIVSALYLQQYSSDPFHICTSYQATSEGVSRVMPVSKFKNVKLWRIFKICNFDFVIFWLGIQYDSMVWVIMRRRGVSSERRRSSCSSLIQISLNFVGEGPINSKSSLVEVMACCRTGDKPLPEPLMTQFTNAYSCL